MAGITLIKLDCSRGAPMGRHTYIKPEGYSWKVHLQRMPMSPDSAYDAGGAYWGASNTSTPPLWVAEFQDYADGCDLEGFEVVRAWSREEAKRELKKIKGWENVKFYR